MNATSIIVGFCSIEKPSWAHSLKKSIFLKPIPKRALFLTGSAQLESAGIELIVSALLRYEPALFLFALSVILGGNWYFLFALPLTLLTGAAAIGCYLMISSKRASISLKMMIVLVILTVFVLLVQMLIELHLNGRIHFDWSIYVAVSCAMLAIAVLIVSRLFRKNESFRKKLFF